MELFLKNNRSKYIYVFTDCVLTKGFTRTSLTDLSRKQIFFIPNSFYELTKTFRTNTIGEVLENLEDDESRVQFYKFLNFLLNERFATLVSDITRFPKIRDYWDHASPITNAIIDIRNKFDFVEKAITELAELRCEYLQIRIFECVSEKLIKYICHLISNKCFKDVEVLVKFDEVGFSRDFFSDIVSTQKNIRFVFHSVPTRLKTTQHVALRFTPQPIRSCGDCGMINQLSLRIPSVSGFMENKLYNSCLNRKIAIDENGNIGNCPSMKKKYGNITTHSLREISERHRFKKIGMINKDQIDECKVCEFRYICSDCRAYTKEGTAFSKPAKCNYDPYTGSWQELTGFAEKTMMV